MPLKKYKGINSRKFFEAFKERTIIKLTMRYPHIQKNQIINMAEKQFKTLTQQNKIQLYQRYFGKSPMLQLIEPVVVQQVGNKNEEQEESEIIKENHQNQQQNLSQEQQVKIEPLSDKKIKKKKKVGKKLSDYLIFQSHYYNIMTIQHPRWEKHQKKKVVDLMWKKRRKTLRKLKKDAKKGTIVKTTKIKVGQKQYQLPKIKTAFNFFASQKSKQLKLQYPQMNISQIARQVGKQWKLLSNQERMKYIEMRNKLKQQCKKKIEEIQNQCGFIILTQNKKKKVLTKPLQNPLYFLKNNKQENCPPQLFKNSLFQLLSK